MNKVSLLAASVAIALAGCGGSDGGSNNNTGGSKGLVVTGFDGYFKNAVVFLDKDNNGILDSTDTVFGLTNEKGQITLPENTDLSTGNIALKTLKPGDVVTLGLGDRIAAATDKVDFASDYSDTYTTDMDLPGQPMEHTIVFRSLQDGDNIVISPITDLVALQPAVVYSTDKTAEEKVCDSLFGESVVTGEACTNKLYSDFTKSDPELHKTAQILTDTKANSADKYNAVSALSAAKVAVESISKLSEEELADPTVRTTIEITTTGATGTLPEFTTAKSLVTAAKYNEIQSAFDRLDIKITKEPAPSKGTLLGTINVANLFTMHNGEVAGLDKEHVIVSDNTFYGRINDKNELELYVVPNEAIEKVGNVNVTLSAEDGSTVAFSFSVDAAEDAVAPTIDTAAVTDLKAEIADLTFVAGQQFNLEDGVILSTESIFDETVKTIELSSNANSIGLTITLSDDQNNILISGRPAHLAAEGAYSIQLKATSESGLSSEVITLPLPAIVEAIAVEETEVKLLQDKINTLNLQVGESISHEGLELDITPLFTQNVGGELEFYAGLEFNTERNDHEYFTTIPGVRVHTDEANKSGKLTISGTPTEATKDGYFYVAAGVNGDTPEEIISKMVKITLPDVQPADDTVEPEPTLGFTEAHFDTDKVWKMGSFADKDGEIGHAMLWGDDQGLLFCWGSDDKADVKYSANITRWDQSAYTTLAQLDALSNYADYDQKDCWDVTLKADGTLSDGKSTYEMLYQNKTVAGDYQIIVKIDGDELFWLDSTDAPFAQSLPVSEKVAKGKIEFDMMVESDTVAEEGTELFYSFGKYEYAEATYEYTSIMPTGFYTPGNLDIDTSGEHEMLILEETGEDSDQKTRYRYVNRNFGDFYVGIKWSKDFGGTSSPDFGLFSYSQGAMEKVVSKLPLLQD
ncbi:hypothetical protein D1115_14900 [Vibrio alfacsensis]|uniref:Acid phosphatase n=1 Tax=Vibrio alfacsensis TaxID=1074311 RepID=A0ABN5PG87_9VIBR|nr:hypothetical protein [Vibrio alfacsensis]AXY02239.1 hypothetical protein D1115_14900 [Vibrio alfacsensis]